MKKSLLFGSALFIGSSLYAAVTEPTTYENFGFSGISPNGRYILSQLYSSSAILDLETGEEYLYDGEIGTFSPNAASNNGVVVGQSMETFAAYWKDGEWYDLEISSMSVAYGITRDGSRIVGSVAPPEYDGSHEGLMLVPCYWDVKEDGTYSDPKVLPFPKTDLTGRVPQYITALSISTDGSVIIGQITDFSGSIYQPILYKLNENNEWSYTLLFNDRYHPEGFVMPEDPGDAPNIQPETFMTPEEIAAYEEAVARYWEISDSLVFPDVQDYMTAEEYAAYQAAVDEFYQTWEGDYPQEKDYMTEEEYEAYQAAIDKYYADQAANDYPDYEDFMTEEEIARLEEARKASDEWDEKWMLFEEALNELRETVPSFVFNNSIISSDGKTAAMTYSKESFNFDDPWAPANEINRPWIVNLEDETYTAYGSEEQNIVVSSMTDNGTVTACKRGNFTDPLSFAYILAAGTEEFLPLYDYFLIANADIANWMKENLTISYESYYYDEDADEYLSETIEAMPTGIPMIAAETGILTLTVENVWDFYNGVDAYAYIIPLDYDASVGSIAADAAEYAIAAYLGGNIILKGDFASVEVYNIAGAKVFSASAPGSTVATGLSSGIYVVKALTADGAVKVAKVAF